MSIENYKVLYKPCKDIVQLQINGQWRNNRNNRNNIRMYFSRLFSIRMLYVSM